MVERDRRQLKAVLWDMDGTLVDSAPHWLVAHQRVARAHAVRWTEGDVLSTVGQSMTFSAQRLQQCGVDLPLDTVADLLVGSVAEALSHDVPWIPGAETVLDEVRAAGILCGLVTTAYRRVAQLVADAAGPVFDVVVAGDDVARTKPDPEPYLAAVAALGCCVEECVAVEDSPSGVTSAHTAGMQVVVVPGAIVVPPAPGRLFVPSLDHVTVALLRGLVAGT